MSRPGDNTDVRIHSISPVNEPVKGQRVDADIDGNRRTFVMIECSSGLFFLEELNGFLVSAPLSKKRHLLVEHIESELERDLPYAFRRKEARVAKELVYRLLERRRQREFPVLLADALSDPNAFRKRHAQELGVE